MTIKKTYEEFEREERVLEGKLHFEPEYEREYTEDPVTRSDDNECSKPKTGNCELNVRDLRGMHQVNASHIIKPGKINIISSKIKKV